MRNYYEDTIASISTALANGAISIVRLSGSEAIEIANKCFMGYRYKIHREGNFQYPDLMDDFTDYEYKFDYGFKAAAGIGLVFSPFELHVKLNMRYGLGDIYRADYASKEYYRYATPFDLILTVGLHYQLSLRSGKTRSQIKEQARRIVYEGQN